MVVRGEIFARCGLNADVAGARNADVDGVVNDPDPRILELSNPFQCVVGRGVVDHDQLEITERLSEDPLDGFGDEGTRVIGGGDNADTRHGNSGERSTCGRSNTLYAR